MAWGTCFPLNKQEASEDSSRLINSHCPQMLQLAGGRQWPWGRSAGPPISYVISGRFLSFNEMACSPIKDRVAERLK